MFFVANLEDGIINNINFYFKKTKAQEKFMAEVKEYGIIPNDTMVDSGVFEGEDGHSVQWGSSGN